MKNLDIVMQRLTFASLIILAIGTFTSISISAGSHILIMLPGLYFAVKEIKNFKKSDWLGSKGAILAIVVSILLSAVFNADELERPFKTFFKGKYFLIAFLAFFAYRNNLENYLNDARKSFLLKLFLIATSLASLSGLYALFFGFNPLRFGPAAHPDRASGTFGMTMTYAYGISLFCIFIVALWKRRDEVKHLIPIWLLNTAAIVNLLGLYFSYARGAWIGFIVALPFLFLRDNFKRGLQVAFAGVGIVLVMMTLSSTVREMFLDRVGSDQGRLAFYETAIRAFQEKPIFGWGYKNFEPNVKALKAKYGIARPEFAGHAHNNFLEHLATTGIIGFLALLWFHLAWLRESWSGQGFLAYISLPFIIGLTVSGLVQVTMGDGENLFFILNLWAMSKAAEARI